MIHSLGSWKRSITVFATICGAVGTPVVLKFSQAPFAWIFSAGGVIALAWTLVSHSTFRRVFLVNLGVILITLAGIEGFFYSKHAASEAAATIFSTKAAYRIPHPILDVIPRPGVVTTATQHHGDTLDFEVTYTIDENGLRVSPPTQSSTHEQCLLFMGCSFTYGHGLNDEDTLPYQTGLKTQGQYQIFNFGFSGYGAHHMLAQLQEGSVEKITKCRPKAVIFSALPHHVMRSAGTLTWAFGPRYKLSEDGSLRFTGLLSRFRESSGFQQSRLLSQLTKSHIIREMQEHESYSREDVELYIRIVKESERLVREKFPGASFDVLLWDDVPNGETSLYSQVRKGMVSAGMTVHHVPDILPHYREDPIHYAINKFDRHPNAIANRTLADYVVNRMLKNSGSVDRE